MRESPGCRSLGSTVLLEPLLTCSGASTLPLASRTVRWTRTDIGTCWFTSTAVVPTFVNLKLKLGSVEMVEGQMIDTETLLLGRKELAAPHSACELITPASIMIAASIFMCQILLVNALEVSG